MASPIRNALVAAAIGAAGLTGAANLVTSYEGYSPTVYIDPVGIKTICRGTTSGPLIAKGKATQDECDRATLADLEAAAAVVRSCVPGALTQGEYNAWTSFALNVGRGAKGKKDGMCMLKSGKTPTHVLLLRAGKPRAACHMMIQWTNPPALKKGLTRRRTDEMALCLRDLPEDAK